MAFRFHNDCPEIFLAMTHHRLGHAEDAKRWLAKCVEKIEKNGIAYLAGSSWLGFPASGSRNSHQFGASLTEVGRSRNMKKRKLPIQKTSE